MCEEVDEGLREVLNEDVDDDDRVDIPHEVVHIDPLEVFYLHDDVDGHEETDLFLVIELLHQDAVGEAIIMGWHLELSQVGLVSSSMERLLTHPNQIC